MNHGTERRCHCCDRSILSTTVKCAECGAAVQTPAQRRALEAEYAAERRHESRVS